jgi:hypothetical protein
MGESEKQKPLKKKQKSPGKKRKSLKEKQKSPKQVASSGGGDFSRDSDSDDDPTFVVDELMESESERECESDGEAEISGNRGLYYNEHKNNQ